MANDYNKRDTEETNLEIWKSHFIVQENTWGSSQEYQNTLGIKWWLGQSNCGTKKQPSKLRIGIPWHSGLDKITLISQGQG